MQAITIHPEKGETQTLLLQKSQELADIIDATIQKLMAKKGWTRSDAYRKIIYRHQAHKDYIKWMFGILGEDYVPVMKLKCEIDDLMRR